jgi:hypothetical protein
MTRSDTTIRVVGHGIRWGLVAVVAITASSAFPAYNMAAAFIATIGAIAVTRGFVRSSDDETPANQTPAARRPVDTAPPPPRSNVRAGTPTRGIASVALVEASDFAPTSSCIASIVIAAGADGSLTAWAWNASEGGYVPSETAVQDASDGTKVLWMTKAGVAMRAQFLGGRDTEGIVQDIRRFGRNVGGSTALNLGWTLTQVARLFSILNDPPHLVTNERVADWLLAGELGDPPADEFAEDDDDDGDFLPPVPAPADTAHSTGGEQAPNVLRPTRRAIDV